MATYVELWDLQHNDAFLKRVKFAILILAASALAGAGAQRKEWARKVFASSSATPINFITLRVLSNPTVTGGGAAVTDEVIQDAVNALLDELVALG
jgi:hypothetical protein